MIKKINTSPLRMKATLVQLSCSRWLGSMIDKRVSEEVAAKYKAAPDAGKYHKTLIEKEHLKRINNLYVQSHTLYREVTRPWGDGGERILPNVHYQGFANSFRKIKRSFDSAADEFAANYESYVQERRKQLGGLFNESDYPDPSRIRGKFALDIHVYPIPDAADFRSDMDESVVQQIREQIAEYEQHALASANQHTLRQIVEVVGHMAKKLGEYKTEDGKKFSGTLVTNIADLCDLLPGFNLNNDPEITRITKRMKAELCAEGPKTLRNNDNVRESVQKSAEEIEAEVRKLIG